MAVRATATKTAPAKSAPSEAVAPAVKPDEAPATQAPATEEKAPAFDIKALAPVAVKPPAVTRAGGAGRTGRDNSMVENWLSELDKTRGDEKVSKEARAIPGVPVAGLPELRTRFVQAAEKLKIGVSLYVSFELNGKGQTQAAGKKLPEGVKTIDLVYTTRVRKQNKAKSEATVPATDDKKDEKQEENKSE